MGIEPYLIASVLKGAIAQRLVRKLVDKKKFKGRTVISEEFIMDTELEKIITHGADQNAIYSYLKNRGMIFLAQDAKNKIRKGITTKAEAEREIAI